MGTVRVKKKEMDVHINDKGLINLTWLYFK